MYPDTGPKDPLSELDYLNCSIFRLGRERGFSLLASPPVGRWSCGACPFGCGFGAEVLSARATEPFASSKGASKELGGASAGTFGAESCDAVGASLIPRWPRPFVFL